MYNLFISHSWAYSDQYDRLVSLLNAAPNFDYRNYSVPKDDPIHNAPYQYQLKEAILAGVYSTYSKWINIEIELAQSMNKKIIAVEPWGASRTSAVVKNAANETVGWNTSSIVRAIRGY